MSRELNLVPQSRGGIRNSKSKNNMILICVAVLLVAVGISFGIRIFGNIYYENKVEAKREELSKSNAKVEEMKNLQNQIKVTKNQILKAEALNAMADIDTDGILTKLRNIVLVDGITIQTSTYYGSNIQEHKNEITFSGTAPTKDALMKVWARLRESDKFKNCQLNRFTKQSDNTYSYQFVISFEGVDLSEEK